ncbi:MAG: cytochrome P450 [Verrucomicrobia bacterium]|nr:cytochrome P450 [Verrucomicrobiota bacterium]
MAFFRRWCSGADQPISSDATITISRVDSSYCTRVARWLKWIVQLPIEIPHMLYTVGLIIKHQEMIVPIQKQIIVGRAIHLMPSPLGRQHIVTSARLASAILNDYRNDEEGLYTIGVKDDNARLFLPLLQDLLKEAVSLEDFLFTCYPQQVEIYRKVVHEFFGPGNLPFIRTRLKEIVKGALAYLKRQEVDGVVRCSGREFTKMFSTAVISNLLLGKEAANFADYQPISQAIYVCMNHAVLKFLWQRPTAEQERAYQDTLKTMQATIYNSEGAFNDVLKTTEMTDAQRRGVLFLMYVAGGETSSSFLEYMLWQLGQHPEYQDALLKETEQAHQDPDSTMNKLIEECLRMHPPTALINRTPRVDLEVSVKSSDGSQWKYLFPKGENIIYSPYFAGRDPVLYDNPHIFDPSRPRSSLSWHPFGRGRHVCLGKPLALAEIRALIEAFTEQYTIQSNPNQAPRQKELLTLTMDPEATLTLTRRKKQT